MELGDKFIITNLGDAPAILIEASTDTDNQRLVFELEGGSGTYHDNLENLNKNFRKA